MTKLEKAEYDWHRASAQMEKLHAYLITLDALTWIAVGIAIGSIL